MIAIHRLNPTTALLIIAGLTAAALHLATTPARAGSCPAAHVTTNGQAPGPSAHKGVTDKVLSMIPLAKEKIGLKEHSLRMRRLVVGERADVLEMVDGLGGVGACPLGRPGGDEEPREEVEPDHPAAAGDLNDRLVAEVPLLGRVAQERSAV